ncbi:MULTISPECIES: hypothetical protein [Halorubrum]|uniref:Uncharacterized protein n=1 Tax=Halorubrum hochstenium ATCC 700873 TaxID=1227481 RepID=M0FM00_9EURY|nr:MULTISPECIES: hypothetical protein [Halorubrum]ELZ60975.1 hypothetical protein C467_02018 [Halorubrum hochstenium ATCC 700873]
MRVEARRAYHVARTDFIARLRSRKLFVFLAVIIYLGYLINSGSFGVFYTVTDGPNINGALTSQLVGLNAGMAGSMVMLLAGFYVLRGTVARDERHGHAPVLSSSQTSKPVYLLGKLSSNAAVGLVTATVLGGAAVINHVIHGVGSTAPVAIVWPVFVMVVPLTVFVGAVALLFGTIGFLDGTFGRVAYFFAAIFLISGQMLRPETALPPSVPTIVKMLDVIGITLAYDLTFQSIQTAVPGFEGGYASFGTGGSNARTFTYTGGPWPTWFFVQRLGTLVAALSLTLIAALPFDWFRAERSGLLSWVSQQVPLGTTEQQAVSPATVAGSETISRPVVAESPVAVESMSLPSVTERGAGGFRRVIGLELRRLLREQPRWWYVGAGLLIVIPAGIVLTSGGIESPRRLLTPVSIWPLFVWSRIGSRTARHGVRPQIIASEYPIGQLLAEWLAGCLVTIGIGSSAFVLIAATAGPTALASIAGTVLFPPSLALVAGLWTGSPRLFEALYLGLWYIGPLNGGYFADFVGSTTRSVANAVPLVFAAAGVFAVMLAARRRRVYASGV